MAAEKVELATTTTAAKKKTTRREREKAAMMDRWPFLFSDYPSLDSSSPSRSLDDHKIRRVTTPIVNSVATLPGFTEFFTNIFGPSFAESKKKMNNNRQKKTNKQKKRPFAESKKKMNNNRQKQTNKQKKRPFLCK